MYIPHDYATKSNQQKQIKITKINKTT
jgi:hypothetical protein